VIVEAREGGTLDLGELKGKKVEAEELGKNWMIVPQ